MTALGINDRIEDLLNGMSGHVALLDRAMTFAAQDLTLFAVVVLVALWF